MIATDICNPLNLISPQIYRFLPVGNKVIDLFYQQNDKESVYIEMMSENIDYRVNTISARELAAISLGVFPALSGLKLP